MTRVGVKATRRPTTRSCSIPSLTRAPGPGKNSPRDSGHRATSGCPWKTVEVHTHKAHQTHPSTHTGPPADLHHTLSPRPRFPLDWTLCPQPALFSDPQGLSALPDSWHTCPSSLQHTHRTPPRETSRSPFSLDQGSFELNFMLKSNASQWFLASTSPLLTQHHFLFWGFFVPLLPQALSGSRQGIRN